MNTNKNVPNDVSEDLLAEWEELKEKMSEQAPDIDAQKALEFLDEIFIAARHEYFGMESDSQVAITLNNTVLEEFATLIDGQVYLDYNFVHDIINERFYWDANENILLYTTSSDVVSAHAEENKYMIGKVRIHFYKINIYPCRICCCTYNYATIIIGRFSYCIIG